MYAVKMTNLTTNPNRIYFTPANNYANAWDILRREVEGFDAMDWHLGEDYEIEVVEGEVDDTFDFDGQEDFN